MEPGAPNRESGIGPLLQLAVFSQKLGFME
jgi:hypothetical protein